MTCDISRLKAKEDGRTRYLLISQTLRTFTEMENKNSPYNSFVWKNTLFSLKKYLLTCVSFLSEICDLSESLLLNDLMNILKFSQL